MMIQIQKPEVNTITITESLDAAINIVNVEQSTSVNLIVCGVWVV